MIEIDETKIAEQISGILSNIMNNEIIDKYSYSNYEISQAVKDIVYSHKDEILDKCIERASRELVKKGLPKLLSKFADIGKDTEDD